MLILAAYVTWNAPKISKGNHPLKDLVPIRYLLLLMGFFAAYCGLMYNDLMSLPLNLFGSCYEIEVFSLKISLNFLKSLKIQKTRKSLYF